MISKLCQCLSCAPMLKHDAPAGSEARAISSIDAMRSEARTSLRGWAGACPFFPFGILCSGDLHRDITRALTECARRGEAAFDCEVTPIPSPQRRRIVAGHWTIRLARISASRSKNCAGRSTHWHKRMIDLRVRAAIGRYSGSPAHRFTAE